jgi:hypothetical protein
LIFAFDGRHYYHCVTPFLVTPSMPTLHSLSFSFIAFDIRATSHCRSFRPVTPQADAAPADIFDISPPAAAAFDVCALRHYACRQRH